MDKDIKITGAGVGSLVSACLLKKYGYDIKIQEKDVLPTGYINVFFKGTLLGAIKITGSATKDAQVLKGIEGRARTIFASYFKELPAQNKPSRLFFVKPESIWSYTRKSFTTSELQTILQFPFVFLGINPKTTVPYPTIEIDTQSSAKHMLAIRLELKKQYRDLAIHNFIVSKNWSNEIKKIIEGKKWPGDPSFYVGKAGKKELIIEIPVSPQVQYKQADLDKYKDWALKEISSALHLPDLEKRIQKTTVIGPKKS